MSQVVDPTLGVGCLFSEGSIDLGTCGDFVGESAESVRLEESWREEMSYDLFWSLYGEFRCKSCDEEYEW